MSDAQVVAMMAAVLYGAMIAERATERATALREGYDPPGYPVMDDAVEQARHLFSLVSPTPAAEP